MIDPRFEELYKKLSLAYRAHKIGDAQSVIENLYHLRETAWRINSDILAQRWKDRPRHSIPRPQRATIDDLLI